MSLVGGEAGAVLRPVGRLLRGRRPHREVARRCRCAHSARGHRVGAGRELRGAPWSRAAAAAGATGTLALPLVLGERVLGVLEVRLPA